MSELKPKPAYYAIIPASVRYDVSLPANAKLLYGEITALCSVEGYCWASNRHFAELYDVKIRAVQTWIKALEAAGHILVEPIDGYRRHIRLPEAERAARVKKDMGAGGAKKDTPPCKKSHGGMTQNTRRGAKKDTHSITTNLTENTTMNSEVLPSASAGEDKPPDLYYSRARRQLVKAGKALSLEAIDATARELFADTLKGVSPC